MPRTETVTTPPTPGAGRRMSYTFFSPGRQSVPNQPNFPNATTPRPFGVPNVAFGNYFTVGGPPAPQGGVIYKGMAVNAITSNTGTGRGITPAFGGVNNSIVLSFQTVKSTGNTFAPDDYACWSVSAILAFDAMPGAITGDIGLALGVGGRASIRSGVLSGLELGPSNTGVTSLIVRQADAGALTFNAVTPTQPDMTEYHLYEFQIISATPTSEARVKALIDGRVQFILNYGVGTVLPSQVEATGLGFTPSIINFNANAATSRMYHVPNGFNVKCGPNEASLL